MKMHDWRLADPAYPSLDHRPWNVEIQETTQESFRVEAVCPEGTTRSVWIEIEDSDLVLHGYDHEHDDPVNLRIGRNSITEDSDRSDDCVKHFNVKRYDAMEEFVRQMAGMTLPEEKADGEVDDLDEDRLLGEYETVMEMVRTARQIVK
ncbi:hypothetical protein [Shinella sp.]|uniref:hypothetical protein n=1 Tax=Shinella sp. TaxID=1870904 RepID=UPI00289AA7F3|nr:hypothetical protein [Shinella sp.]